MLFQYIHHLAERFDHKKTLDQLQTFASTPEGAVGITAAVALVAGASYLKNKNNDRGCPKVPGSSVWGTSTEEYRADPKAFIVKWQNELGPVYHAELFGHTATVVSGSYVREIFLNDKFDFMAGLHRTFDNMLLTNCGPYEDLSAAHTSEVVKKFLSPHLKHFTPRVIEHLQQGLKAQTGEISAEGKQFPHVYGLVQHPVALASASVFVGPELSKNELLIDSFKNMVIDVGSELLPNPWLEPFPRLNRLRMWWVGKTSSTVKRHRGQLATALKPELDRRLKAMASNDSNWERPDDILQNLLEHYTPPKGMDTLNYMVNWMTQLTFAAIHTTSEGSTWVLYRLLQTPGLWEELYQEQNEVLEASGIDSSAGAEVFTREILNKFVKMDSVIRETMRARTAYITLPHINKSNEVVTLSNGAKIYPGESAYINVWSNHNDPSLQNSMKDLQQFKPLRFLDAEKNSTKIGEDFLFFGMGKHACPGRWFAVQEIKTIVALLLREYKLEAVGDLFFPEVESIPFPMGEFKIYPRKQVA
ncbi:cytochrome P450 [Hesseltinella vesiculosa]|uniref:Cytochrome P450 n=1 Tax=Hesseltinella vesiculosa TaxID=101127 RepID=A0A1X2GSN6_9FUNG|nr:cytochrome P450 [Hesseltinella vesiculosa]